MSVHKYYPNKTSKPVQCGPAKNQNNFLTTAAKSFSNHESTIIEKEYTNTYELDKQPRSIYNLETFDDNTWRFLPTNPIVRIHLEKNIETTISFYLKLLICGSNITGDQYTGKTHISLRVVDPYDLDLPLRNKLLQYYQQQYPILDNVREIYQKSTELVKFEYSYGGDLRNPYLDAQKFRNLDQKCEYYDDKRYDISTLRKYLRNIKYTSKRKGDIYFMLFWNVDSDSRYLDAFKYTEIRESYLKFEDLYRDDLERFIVGSNPSGSFIDAMPNQIATYYQETNSFYFEQPYKGMEITVHEPFGLYKYDGIKWIQTYEPYSIIGDILPIKHGGTSANNKEDAIRNLDSVYDRELIPVGYPLFKNCKYVVPLVVVNENSFSNIEIIGLSEVDTTAYLKITAQMYYDKTNNKMTGDVIYNSNDDVIRGINLGEYVYNEVKYFGLQIDTNESTGKLYTSIRIRGRVNDLKLIQYPLCYKNQDEVVIPEIDTSAVFDEF